MPKKDAAIYEYVAAHPSPLERGVEEIAAATAMTTTDVFLIAGASDRLRVRNIALGWHLVEQNIGEPAHPLGFNTPWP